MFRFDGSLNGQLVAVDWLWIVCEKCSFGCFVVVPFVSKKSKSPW